MTGFNGLDNLGNDSSAKEVFPTSFYLGKNGLAITRDSGEDLAIIDLDSPNKEPIIISVVYARSNQTKLVLKALRNQYSIVRAEFLARDYKEIYEKIRGCRPLTAGQLRTLRSRT